MVIPQKSKKRESKRGKGLAAGLPMSAAASAAVESVISRLMDIAGRLHVSFSVRAVCVGITDCGADAFRAVDEVRSIFPFCTHTPSAPIALAQGMTSQIAAAHQITTPPMGFPGEAPLGMASPAAGQGPGASVAALNAAASTAGALALQQQQQQQRGARPRSGAAVKSRMSDNGMGMRKQAMLAHSSKEGAERRVSHAEVGVDLQDLKQQPAWGAAHPYHKQYMEGAAAGAAMAASMLGGPVWRQGSLPTVFDDDPLEGAEEQGGEQRQGQQQQQHAQAQAAGEHATAGGNSSSEASSVMEAVPAQVPPAEGVEAHAGGAEGPGGTGAGPGSGPGPGASGTVHRTASTADAEAGAPGAWYAPDSPASPLPAAKAAAAHATAVGSPASTMTGSPASPGPGAVLRTPPSPLRKASTPGTWDSDTSRFRSEVAFSEGTAADSSRGASGTGDSLTQSFLLSPAMPVNLHPAAGSDPALPAVLNMAQTLANLALEAAHLLASAQAQAEQEAAAAAALDREHSMGTSLHEGARSLHAEVSEGPTEASTGPYRTSSNLTLLHARSSTAAELMQALEPHYLDDLDREQRPGGRPSQAGSPLPSRASASSRPMSARLPPGGSQSPGRQGVEDVGSPGRRQTRPSSGARPPSGRSPGRGSHTSGYDAPNARRTSSAGQVRLQDGLADNGGEGPGQESQLAVLDLSTLDPGVLLSRCYRLSDTDIQELAPGVFAAVKAAGGYPLITHEGAILTKDGEKVVAPSSPDHPLPDPEAQAQKLRRLYIANAGLIVAQHQRGMKLRAIEQELRARLAGLQRAAHQLLARQQILGEVESQAAEHLSALAGESLSSMRPSVREPWLTLLVLCSVLLVVFGHWLLTHQRPLSLVAHTGAQKQLDAAAAAVSSINTQAAECAAAAPEALLGTGPVPTKADTPDPHASPAAGEVLPAGPTAPMQLAEVLGSIQGDAGHALKAIQTVQEAARAWAMAGFQEEAADAAGEAAEGLAAIEALIQQLHAREESMADVSACSSACAFVGPVGASSAASCLAFVCSARLIVSLCASLDSLLFFGACAPCRATSSTHWCWPACTPPSCLPACRAAGRPARSAGPPQARALTACWTG